VWRSEKLLQVEPESFRAEFTNMLPLALANGVFECNPAKIRSDVYSFNRPSFTLRKIERILDEFERVNLLFRWRDANGRVWGVWRGIRSGGLLPTPEECQTKRYKVGPEPPADWLAQFLGTEVVSHREFVGPWKNMPHSDGQTARSNGPHADFAAGKSQHTDNERLNDDLPVGNPRAVNAQPMGSTLVGNGKGVGVGAGEGVGDGSGVGSQPHQSRDAVLRATNSGKAPFKKKKNLTDNIQALITERDGSFASYIERCKTTGHPHPFDATVQKAFKAMEYSPDLNDPMLTEDFVEKLESIFEVHCRDGMTPAMLCTKVMDSCERERKIDPDGCYWWPPSFAEHRDRLREGERAAERGQSAVA